MSRQVDVSERDILEMQGLIRKLEMTVPNPPVWRDTCPIPGCSTFKEPGVHPYSAPVNDLQFWTGHFQQRHAEFADAILGYNEDLVDIRSADGTTVVYEPSGLMLKKRPLYFAVSTNGYAQSPSQGRVQFTAVGKDFVFNETPIAIHIRESAQITHYALFDAPSVGLNLTEWRPMPGYFRVKPGDRLEMGVGQVKVGLSYPRGPKLAIVPTKGVEVGEMVAYPPPPIENAYAHIPTGVKAIEDMGYHMAIHPRFGWTVKVDREDGATQEFWRPTRKWADNTGYRRLMREVARRERLIASRTPRSMLMRDIRGTSNDPRALAEWDEEFNASA